MNVLGINLISINARRELDFKRTPLDTSVQFVDLEKDKIDLIKDSEVIKLFFDYSLTYANEDSKNVNGAKQAEVHIKGFLLLVLSKDELKEVQKSWKKKELPGNMQIPLYNLILKKCSLKAANLEEDLGITIHLPIPQIKPSNQANNNQ